MSRNESAPAIGDNDLVAFVVEIGALVALCAWGLRTGPSLWSKLLLGIGVPSLAIALWAFFAAPRAPCRVLTAEILVKILVLGGAAAACYALFPLGWAVLVTVVVTVNTILLYVGPWARRSRGDAPDR
ncbi:MAG TPA: YrdB family protein [Actinopolymorphaceae bacterium]